MRIGLINNRTLINVLAISIILFNGHKIAGRFGSLPKEEIGNWAKEWPGLIITHQPFETMEIAMATTAVYLFITGLCFYLGAKILSDSRHKKYIPWFFAFICAWGVHEVHHIFSTYPNGKLFAFWFSFSALIVLPAMLTWNRLIVFLYKPVFEKPHVFGPIAHILNDPSDGYWRSISPMSWELQNNFPAFDARQSKRKVMPGPFVKTRNFYRLE